MRESRRDSRGIGRGKGMERGRGISSSEGQDRQEKPQGKIRAKGKKKQWGEEQQEGSEREGARGAIKPIGGGRGRDEEGELKEGDTRIRTDGKLLSRDSPQKEDRRGRESNEIGRRGSKEEETIEQATVIVRRGGGGRGKGGVMFGMEDKKGGRER